MTRSAEGSPASGFERSHRLFEAVVDFLDGEESKGLSHGELEAHLDAEGRDVLRQLFQDHLDLRAEREVRVEVVDAAEVAHRRVEEAHERSLATIFGQVVVSRLAYRAPDRANLHPADASLNLPVEKHSHGLRHLAAIEATRGSFDGTVEAIERSCGQVLGKRQVQALAERAAVDFDTFYAIRAGPSAEAQDALVLSADGKGIVMRPEALRPATAKAAASGATKLATRLSKGEKRNRKRMATVGAVYDLSPIPRSPADILPEPEAPSEATPAPQAKAKWLLASVVEDAATVVSKIFDEAERRDPLHLRHWVALVDGNNHQIDRLGAEAEARGVEVAVVIDFVHVMEYLWKAAWSFYDEGDPGAEVWVHDQARGVLAGHASRVAGAIRRKATYHGLAPPARANADIAATYLTNKAPFLDYPSALSEGWPIATGVIEGACRHLIADRMDITGARWGLDGAEAVLKLRAIHSNGDFPDYWRHHLAQERRRNHEERYAGNTIPAAA